MNNNVLENRFKLEEPIAKGVSGGVFKAKDLQSGQTVAVKLLYTPPGADQNFGVRFKREADVLFDLDHPNIVKILHSGVTPDGVIYYAMEFVNGVTLERYLNARERLSVAETADFLDQIASALDAVHSRKIVHRDVTPSNIMIEADATGRSRAKLIDFGFAKDVGMGATAKGGPATGRLMLGVAAYMSPEVLAGKPATHYSDIHALGVTTALMLTGKHPFLRDAEVATIAAVLEESPPSLKSLAPDADIPDELDAVVAQTMAKRPTGRPQSAGEFAAKFRLFAGHSANNVGESPSSMLRRASLGGSSVHRKGAMARPTSMSGSLPKVAQELSPSGRYRPLPASPVAESSSLVKRAVEIRAYPPKLSKSASWAVPILGVVAVLGGVYALINLMAS